jgi:hypothetical protein
VSVYLALGRRHLTSYDSCGLHQIISPVWEDNQGEGSSRTTLRASAPWSVSDMSVRRPGSMLPPPKDGSELGQRIIVFWETYLLDKVRNGCSEFENLSDLRTKLGSAVTSLPGSLPDEADPLVRYGVPGGGRANNSSQTEILTAWPRTIDEYERVRQAHQRTMRLLTLDVQGDVRSDETVTVRNLYEPYYSQVLRRRPETLQGLQVQVTALHERASRLSPTYNAGQWFSGPPLCSNTTLQTHQFREGSSFGSSSALYETLSISSCCNSLHYKIPGLWERSHRHLSWRRSTS